jgi:basic membrane protein A
VLALACAATLAACGSEAASPESSSPGASAAAAAACGTPDQFCIGLVLEAGGVDDGAFNAAVWQGVQGAATSAGGIAAYATSDGAASYAANLDDFAARGFDVVVASGVAQPQATIDAATAHPETTFVGISQDLAAGPDNAIGLVFRDDEAGYAAGYLAGAMTQSGVVGAVLGSEQVIPLRRFGEGFRLGVLAARPDARVIMAYNNDSPDSFNDPEWGAATAATLVADGADIVFGAGGTTGTAALEAVAAMPGAGTSLFCIGIDVDQYETVPAARPCLLTSAEKRIASGVEDAIAQLRSGSPLPRNIEGDVGLSPYRDLAGRVPDAVRQRVDGIVQGLIDGSVSTGVTF